MESEDEVVVEQRYEYDRHPRHPRHHARLPALDAQVSQLRGQCRLYQLLLQTDCFVEHDIAQKAVHVGFGPDRACVAMARHIFAKARARKGDGVKVLRVTEAGSKYGGVGGHGPDRGLAAVGEGFQAGEA